MNYRKHRPSMMGSACYQRSQIYPSGTVILGDWMSDNEIPSYMEDRFFCEYCGSELDDRPGILNCQNCGAPKTKECYAN